MANDLHWEHFNDKLESFNDVLNDIREDLESQQELYDFISRNIAVFSEILKEQHGLDLFDDVLSKYTMFELFELLDDESSIFYNVYQQVKAIDIKRAAEEAARVAQEAGRQARREIKEKAIETNAIMEIGNYTIFSSDGLWEAFAPRHIVKMGTLDRNFINQETGEVTKYAPTADLIETGEFEETKALEIPLNAAMLISTIMQNSVGDIKKEFVKDGQITFYVKGIIESITNDPRGLIGGEIKEELQDQQLTLDRKTAGVLYLEEQFKPLQELIGITPNGSRYSVLNYYGYNAENDTMTITSPYIFQLWKATQESYFRRQRNLITANSTNKKPVSDDMKPLEINYLFKGATYQEEPITLEIAVYITDKILQAGYKGKPKKTEINYKTLINECPKLRERLADIESKRGTLTDKGKPVNITSFYNAEFKKIKKAFDLIQDPEKCDALKEYEFIDIKPANKINNSYFEFIPPTKSLIDGKLIITWKKKKSD